MLPVALREYLSKWDHVPWHFFNPPSKTLATHPTFLAIELLFFVVSGFAFQHALRNGRSFVALWFASVAAGCANDVFFMWLPTVDNFWHAQATLMLTPRLPLYVLCIYNVVMYYSTVFAWRLGLGRVSESALVGIVAMILYAPFDILGAKFLWWTWHDTDVAIAERLLGVPIGSTLWIMIFTATFSFLMRSMLGAKVHGRDNSLVRAVTAVVVATLFSTPLMLVQMVAFQVLELPPGKPGLPTLLLAGSVYAFVALLGIVRRTTHEQRTVDRAAALLRWALTMYSVVLVVIALHSSPTNSISTSIHQLTGPCYIEEFDHSGNRRYKYLCVTDYNEEYSLKCHGSAPPGANTITDWYTICGTPHSDPQLFIFVVTGLCLLGTIVNALLFITPPQSPSTSAAKKTH